MRHLIDNTQSSYAEIISHITDLLAKGFLESNFLKLLAFDSNFTLMANSFDSLYSDHAKPSKEALNKEEGETCCRRSY